jgi:hypothetical protein
MAVASFFLGLGSPAAEVRRQDMARRKAAVRSATPFLRRQRPPHHVREPLRERRRVGQGLAADDAGLVEQEPSRDPGARSALAFRFG